MISLGIDTTLSSVSFAVVKKLRSDYDNTAILAEYNSNLGRNLSQKIPTIITNLMNIAKISPKDINRCGIVTGPGSFTGLRIGIAFAKGFFADTDAGITGISTLECATKASRVVGEISVFMDARQDEVFFAKFFRSPDGNVERVSKDERINIVNAIEKCSKGGTLVYSLSGNANSPIKQLLHGKKSVEIETLTSRGAVAAGLATTNEAVSIDEVFPNYMQVSYAERCGI